MANMNDDFPFKRIRVRALFNGVVRHDSFPLGNTMRSWVAVACVLIGVSGCKPQLDFRMSPDQGQWQEHPFVNSLGMKFVPVLINGGPTNSNTSKERVLFCMHDTRKQDYRQYAEAKVGVDGSWKNVEDNGVPVSNGEDHPVVMVNWKEAKAFCRWLSDKEGRTYRLPTDHEWSCAVGIGNRENLATIPINRVGSSPELYPWGAAWPPPKGSGNIADETVRRKFFGFPVIEGYDDGFLTTSPVMSFPPNKLGLYDMAGNVSQWCEDWCDAEEKFRVLRGSSWFTYDPQDMLSCIRFMEIPEARGPSHGFRIVLVVAEEAMGALQGKTDPARASSERK
jgi:hypothetical protein